VERKAAGMAYDWQRRYQLGSMPLPNPFADDNLNMFHDAPSVLRRVRQPVLAVFGGMDTLTPPRESAALWASELRRRGEDDYSVRLFPRGTHGLFEGGKTGSPLELLPETRWVPGYFDTVIRWVHHHTGGPTFPDARRVDTNPNDIPVQSRGLYSVSWFGSGAVQPWLLLLSLTTFASAALAAPAAWLWRRLRGDKRGTPPGSERIRWLVTTVGAVNLAILVGLTFVLYRLVEAQPSPVIERLRTLWNALTVAEWLSLVLTAWATIGCMAAWRKGWWSRGGRACYTLAVTLAIAWISFAIYWDLVWPAW